MLSLAGVYNENFKHRGVSKLEHTAGKTGYPLTMDFSSRLPSSKVWNTVPPECSKPLSRKYVLSSKFVNEVVGR